MTVNLCDFVGDCVFFGSVGQHRAERGVQSGVCASGATRLFFCSLVFGVVVVD